MHGIKEVAVMRIAGDRFSRADDASAIADLLRGILLFIWCMVRVPIVIVLAFLEPVVRLLLIGIAVLSLLSGLVYLGSNVVPAIPFWVMVCVSIGCVMLLAVYQYVLRLLSR